MNFNYHSYTIEFEKPHWVVFGHGEYPEDSVLAGEYARNRLAHCKTLAEAQALYPRAEVPEYSTRIPSGWLPVSDLPPAWFDPAACGERWDEDY